MQLPPTARPDRKPTVLLTTHKAGSKIANRILAALHASIEVPSIDLAKEAWQQGTPPGRFLSENVELLDAPGYYFGALRTPIAMAAGWYTRQRAVVHVRDPRDCVVSAYFSAVKGHRVPPGELSRRFLALREKVSTVTVDEFAVKHAIGYAQKTWMLHQIAEQHPDCLVSRYERMVTDTEGWLREICAFLDIPLTSAARAAIASFVNFSVPREQPDKMKRQVAPGDYLRKLTPESIADIEETLADVLRVFGYAAPSASMQAAAS